MKYNVARATLQSHERGTKGLSVKGNLTKFHVDGFGKERCRVPRLATSKTKGPRVLKGK